MKVRKLQSRTAKGVRIGDNESQIVARLGRPSRIERAGPMDQVRIFRYESQTASDRSGYETYTFKSGRLVSIEFRARRDDDED